MESRSAAEEIEKIFGYKFKNTCLLDKALTHSSWANESNMAEQHNERQEFLGDAVLELCVSTELYLRFPNAREGDLTKMRARLVSGASLYDIAKRTGLDKLVKLGVGEERQGGRDRPTVLGDAFEAVLGAVYEDGGFEVARSCVQRIFADYWPKTDSTQSARDYKSRLQQICQHIFHDVPLYSLEGTQGAEHAKIFATSVRLPDGQIFHGRNTSCKKAEQDAAAAALARLEQIYDRDQLV